MSRESEWRRRSWTTVRPGLLVRVERSVVCDVNAVPTFRVRNSSGLRLADSALKGLVRSRLSRVCLVWTVVYRLSITFSRDADG